MSKRTDAIRQVLDLIEANPGVLEDAVKPQYFFESKTAQIDFDANDLNIHLPSVYSDEEDYAAQKVLVRGIIRAFGGTWEKNPSGDGRIMYFQRDGIFGYFSATIYASRNAVCERVVTGTKEVAHDAVEAVDAFTETVDVVEWECGLLLANDEKAVA